MCKMFIGGSIYKGTGGPEKACGEPLVEGEEGKGVLVETCQTAVLL